MPVTKSAKKKLAQDKKKTQRNKPVMTRARRAIIDFRKDPTPDRLKVVYRLIDRAAKKNIFKKNKASRLKSRLAKLLQKTKPEQSKRSRSSKRKKTSKKS